MKKNNLSLHKKRKKKLNLIGTFNPNCTRRGQSWPCQLWCWIVNKILMYWIYKKKTYFCRNVFLIILNFWHDVKKLHFDIHFDIFSSKVHKRHPANPPPLPLGFTAIKGHQRAGEVLWTVVCSPAWPWSEFQSGSSPGPHWVRGMESSQSGQLFCSFLFDNWRCTVLGKFPKP